MNIDKQIDNWTKPSHFPIAIINTDVVVDYKDKFKEIIIQECSNMENMRNNIKDGTLNNNHRVEKMFYNEI